MTLSQVRNELRQGKSIACDRNLLIAARRARQLFKAGVIGF
jgi:hypothetical protein